LTKPIISRHFPIDIGGFIYDRIIFDEGNVRREKSLQRILTNLAVAWFSAGVISPFFTKPKSLVDILFLAIFGIIGALFSLRFAVLSIKGGKL